MLTMIQLLSIVAFGGAPGAPGVSGNHAERFVRAIAEPSDQQIVFLYQQIESELVEHPVAERFAIALIDAVDNDARFAPGSTELGEAVYVLSQLALREDLSIEIRQRVVEKLFQSVADVQAPDQALNEAMESLLRAEQPAIRSAVLQGVTPLMRSEVTDRFAFCAVLTGLARSGLHDAGLQQLAIDMLDEKPAAAGTLENLNGVAADSLHPRLVYALTLSVLSGGNWQANFAAAQSADAWSDEPLAAATAILQAVALHHEDVARAGLEAGGIWAPENQAAMDRWLAKAATLMQAADAAQPVDGYAGLGHVNGVLWLVHQPEFNSASVPALFSASMDLFMRQRAARPPSVVDMDDALIEEKIRTMTPPAYEPLIPAGL